MNLLVLPDGTAEWNGRRFACALGRTGVVDAAEKREGDGATPAGMWAFRRILFRADRISPPQGSLIAIPIEPDDGWCDDPARPDYNRPVKLPFRGGHEIMWRGDSLYDLVVVLGHNDDPPVAGLGSAIFLHVAADGYAPTEGCVALALEDLRAVAEECSPDSSIDIRGSG